MRIQTKDKKLCCGCTACEAICSHQAITMKPDGLGFLYPEIDDDRCVDCGLCNKVCQFTPDYNHWGNYDLPNVFGARNNNADIVARSQSGAMFFTFSEHCLEQGYVVYGAVLDNNFRAVRHARATTKAERNSMLNSKYIQSDMRGVYSQVRKDLKQGYKVLFSGTPCQVAGLKSFVGKRQQDNLLTIDIVCHAVPSPAVWASYVDYVERKNKSKIKDVRFRDKRYGQSQHFETFSLFNGRFLKKGIFSNMFGQHYIVRESCSNCPFTNMHRVGDVTIGDYWGWHEKHTEFNDDFGVSLVIVNSDKGKELLSACQEQLDIVTSNTTECLQPQLIAPMTPSPQYDDFTQRFITRGFEHVAGRYKYIGWRKKVKDTIAFIKNTIKNIIGENAAHALGRLLRK